MSCPNLITCGDNVKIWDFSAYSLLHQFQPNNTKDDVVTDVSWSRDGSMVASVTSRQALLVVTGITNDSTRQLVMADDLTKPTCCRFCTSNSRYICVGSHSGAVDLWDNKSGKMVKQYQGHSSPVTRVCFSGSDRHVASGSRAGQVLVHNVTSGVVTELPTARSEPQCVRDLRYSAVSPALVGAAFDTGHVSLWDVNQRRLLHTFTGGHVAPASGIVFSPVNDILLASVGLDKRLVCYDPKSKSVIQTVSSDAPLTAVDFFRDGVQLAVGTSQGRLCVYDLRSPGRPSRAFVAHRSSVQRVQFQPSAKARNRSSGAQHSKENRPLDSHSHMKSVGDSAGVQSTPVARTAVLSHSTPNEDARPPVVPVDDSHHSRYAQVSTEQSSLFSPLRDEVGCKLTPPIPAEAALDSAAPGVSHHGRDSSVFSPVRGSVSLATTPPAPGPVVTAPAFPAVADGSLFSPLRSDHSLAAKEGGAHLSTPPEPLPNGGGVPAASSAPPGHLSNGPCRSEPEGTRLQSGGGAAGDGSGGTEQLLDGRLEGERRRDVLAELAFGGHRSERRPLPSHNDKTDEPASAPPPPPPHSVVERLEGLQMKMEDMWWGIRRENFNTQWTFGKHMYEVKTSMENMASTIDYLKSEVQRLRDENQYLGCKF